MQVTGTYNNYVSITNLLSPLGVKGSANLVMQVFSSAVSDLQDRIDKQIFSAESDAAIKGLYKEISDLGVQAEKLTLTDFNSVFFDRTAASSDSNVLTATGADAFSLGSGATEATYEITVGQLAQAQRNTGVDLAAGDAGTINQGTNTFNININGEDHELSVEVVEGETNEDVLLKMQEAVNAAGIGVTAEAIAGSVEGTRQLVVTADQTGASGSFTITDVSGNAVAATGAATVSATAQDASYTVDGENRTSGSNTVYLDNGLVTVELKGTGESTLTVAADPKEIANAITFFVSQVNSTIDFLEENKDYIKENVAASVKSSIAKHKNELESFGITQTDDGRLAVDSEQLAAAAGSNLSAVKETFAGFDGLAVQTKTYAGRVSTDSPLNYAREAENMGSDFAEYVYGASATMLERLVQGMMLDTFV